MITFLLLLGITLMVLLVTLLFISIGGTVFIIFAADIIVAMFIVWLIFFRRKRKE